MASNFDPNVPLATTYKDNSVIKFFIIKDVDGNRYLDMVLSYGPMVLGHRHKKVEKNITECRVWQKKLWEEWRLTWAPKEIGKVVDQYYYGPKD